MSARSKKVSPGNRKYFGKARANWLYNTAEVQELYDVCANTVRNWRRAGLRSTKTRVRLFLGRDLNAFHKKRREDAKRPCGPNEIFCVCCKQKHSLLRVPFEVSGPGRFRMRVIVTCPETGGRSPTYISETKHSRLRQALRHKSSPKTGV